MYAKPKPVKTEKTWEEKVLASKWCKRHKCFKWECHPHKPSKAKPRKPVVSRKPIRVKPKDQRRKYSKSERTILESELDRLCSKYVIHRDKRCVTCGSVLYKTCSHFVKRQYQILRYDVDENLHCQCMTCNEFHNRAPKAYETFLTRKYGPGIVEKLHIIAASKPISFRWSVPELRDMLASIKAKLSESH